MTKNELDKRVTDHKQTTHDALQEVWGELNKGQRNKLLKNPKIKALLDRYGVDHE